MQVEDGNRFIYQPWETLPRPTLVTVIGVVSVVLGVIGLLLAIYGTVFLCHAVRILRPGSLMILFHSTDPTLIFGEHVPILIIAGAISALRIVAGRALLKGREWARIALAAVSCLYLLPIVMLILLGLKAIIYAPAGPGNAAFALIKGLMTFGVIAIIHAAILGVCLLSTDLKYYCSEGERLN